MRGQSTVEVALILPVLAGLMALTLQGGIVLSDQIALQHYANEGGLWAQRNEATATVAGIQTHIYNQVCGGASGPPSILGSKYCRTAGLGVAVTELTTPTAEVVPAPTSDVLGTTTCQAWDIAVTPTAITSAQGNSVSYTVTLGNIVSHGNAVSPKVSLSLSGYPNATSPGFPTFNPPSVSSTSPTSILTFSTTSATTPQAWTMQFGGRDQCGVGSSTGLVAASLTVTGSTSSPPCAGGVTVSQPTPSSVTSGTATNITIPGTGFVSGAMVTFGATAASSVVVTSANQLTAVVPATLGVGIYNVTVTNSGGCSGSVFNGLTVGAAAGPSPSPSSAPAGYNACSGGAGSFESRIVITYNEPMLVPWLTSSMQLTATQFTFCQ